MAMSDRQIWSTYIASQGENHKRATETGVYTTDFDWLHKCYLVLLLIIYRLLSSIYHIFYFYFAPYLVLFLVLYV